jgi:hypothetical protein
MTVIVGFIYRYFARTALNTYKYSVVLYFCNVRLRIILLIGLVRLTLIAQS